MDYIFSIVCDLTNCVWGVPQIIECDLLCEQVSKIISLEISNITVFEYLSQGCVGGDECQKSCLRQKIIPCC